MQLYRSSSLPWHWVAWSEGPGWMMFPAKPAGWNERKPYRGETENLMRIPAWLGFNTGFPHPDGTPVRAIDEHVVAAIRPKGRRVA